MTPFFRRIASEHTGPTHAATFEEMGADVGGIDKQSAHGSMYRRIVPLVGAKSDKGKVPPNAVLWLATRLHPTCRKREKTATRTLRDKPYLTVIEQWETEPYEWVELNTTWSSIDPNELDAAAVADHLTRLDAHLVSAWVRHHQLHGSDLGPIGDLRAHTNK
ncbi:MAG: hypothetical protein ACI8Y4_002464 [Candidatus Poriferisodalaceae bacterium]|jgi:hypothetical protein